MTLSYRQHRELAAIEQDLSTGPILPALNELFTEPPDVVATSTPVQAPEPTASPRPKRWSTWLAAAVALLGIADAILAGLSGMTTLTSIGVIVAVSAVAVVAADIFCPDRSTRPRMQDPFRRS